MHVTLRCPALEASERFFTDVLGLLITERAEGSVALRCFGDRARASVRLVAARTPGIDSTLWLSTTGADSAPFPDGWRRTEEGLEAASPDGHVARVAGRLDSFAAPAPRQRNQPSPRRGVGIEPRRLSHVALLAVDAAASASWWMQSLGFEPRERIESDALPTIVALGVSAQPLDLILFGGGRGLHHVAFAVDSRDALFQAIDILAEGPGSVEAGPGQHGLAEMAFVYAREPSGNRIALTHSPLLALPGDWLPITWSGRDAERAMRSWGAPLPETFWEGPT